MGIQDRIGTLFPKKEEIPAEFRLAAPVKQRTLWLKASSVQGG